MSIYLCYHFSFISLFSVYMKKLLLKYTVATTLLALSQAYATVCPDPNNSSLQWGVVPLPWQINPFSDNRPQGEKNTRFMRANILVAGFGRGVVCNYQNSVGLYSIWWPVSVKIPARTDNFWRDSLAGFECTDSLDSCVFYPGPIDFPAA